MQYTTGTEEQEMTCRQIITAAALLIGINCVGAKELKVLMIGNSFSICVGRNLPQIVNSVPGNKLELTSAYIGGCTFDRHSGNLKKAEEDPNYKPYAISIWNSDPKVKKTKGFKGNVNTLLKNNQYDIITIQQGSPKSWDYKFYQPFADELIAYIRKYQPKAEIVIQQTWAYRSDDRRLQPNPKAKWKFDQTGMYERIRDAYRQLAAKYKFRVIPTGDAVQKFRKYTPVKFQPASGEFEFPKLPSCAGDVVGRAFWKQDPKSEKQVLRYDRIHLNPAGEYMQACLWFAFLYGEKTDKIAFVPNDLKEQSELLHKCAQEALDEYKQE